MSMLENLSFLSVMYVFVRSTIAFAKKYVKSTQKSRNLVILTLKYAIVLFSTDIALIVQIFAFLNVSARVNFYYVIDVPCQDLGKFDNKHAKMWSRLIVD